MSDFNPARLNPFPVWRRDASMDVIRGLAICGIVFPNVLHLTDLDRYFVGLAERWPEPHNRVTLALVVGLFSGKMMSLLTFLFGIGIAWQARKFRKANKSPRSFLFRRFFALVLLGTAHYVVLFPGDILTTLGVTGIVATLIVPARPFQRIRSLRKGCGCATLMALFCAVVLALIVYATNAGELLDNIANDTEAEDDDYLWHWYLYGTYLDTVYIRLYYWSHYQLTYALVALFMTLPMVLAGAVFYQSGVWHVAARSPRRVAALWICIATLGILMEAMNLSVTRGGSQEPDDSTPLPYVLSSIGGPVTLGVTYALGLRMILTSPKWLRRFSWFQYVGRFALSVYVLQGIVLGLLLFGYGAGLMESSDTLLLIGMAAVLNAVLVVGARIYSRYWQYGPLEWVWRILSYGWVSVKQKGTGARPPENGLPRWEQLTRE